MQMLNSGLQQEIDKTFQIQKKHSEELRRSTCRQRLQILERFEKAFKESITEIYQAADDDFCRPKTEVDMSEIMVVLGELALVRKNLKKWMKPKKVLPTAMLFGTSSQIIREPKGVTLIISPWNYAFNLTFNPMIWAIAAGNTAIIKPSEHSPNMSAVIEKIIKATFDPQHVSIFQGDSSVAEYLTNMPFDHIFFTGSPAVGKHVMGAAAKNLASVTLELGGKSPVIIHESANLIKAADSIVFSKFLNNGQTCIAPDYLMVHESIYDKFLDKLRISVSNQFGDEDGFINNKDYGRLVTKAHFQRLKDLLDDSINSGASIAVGGKTDSDSKFISPTILTDVKEDSAIMNHEIFGPLLPVMKYGNIVEAINFINNKPKPLALYVFGSNSNIVNKVISSTSSGDACINQCAMHFLHHNLPFGGANNSGIGKSGGVWGFEAFSHERSVLKDKFFPAGLMRPPYTPKVKRLVKAAIKMTS